MVKEIDGKVVIDPEVVDKGSVKKIREGLINLMVDATGNLPLEMDNLCDLAWVIRILSEEQ
ncbi:hypothetical protein M2480_002054 [Parabacteroides sp. PFB2-12]|uniref:hypothetical protein n=1 Tax=unclassified Parabacteroides TaxID=2649774 RepID=UPI002473DD83|nr:MULTISPECIES: hypothetical protein [unclassified Parabacteroides]MDH6342920.1 hypothetical protein [Parabacteroides sp. PM6-13]MDH6391065.1 hypothetical protein [Parabacteroides sp. PFB2-12]